MSRNTRLKMVGKFDQIERERLADELPPLARVLRREWKEQCQQRAEATAPREGSAVAKVSVEFRAS